MPTAKKTPKNLVVSDIFRIFAIEYKSIPSEPDGGT